jgi:HlyD family secretion protein
MKKSTKIILVAGVVLIAGGIIAKKAGWIGKSTAMEVVVEEVVNRTIIETVSANGKIQPEIEVKISADVSGEIVELHVIEGQKVNKGDHLLTINPDLIRAAADRVAAALNQAKANLANSKARELQVKAGFVNIELSYNRSKKLHDQKAISDAEFDATRAQFDGGKADLDAAHQTVLAAEFAVKSAEASLKEANDNLGRTRIYAPTDGTVSKLNIELGERVVGTAQMSGTELLRIANLNEMEVSVDVNENDIVRIHLNDTTDIDVDAYGDRIFKGIVTEISNSANSSLTGNSADQVTNFTVKIRILRESYTDLIDTAQIHLSPFRPGMSATVDIRTKVIANVLSVPIMSVTTRTAKELKGETNNSEETKAGEESKTSIEDEVQEVVFVVKDGITHAKVVTTGIQDNSFIQILTGLGKDDQVVAAPYTAISKLLKEGSEVQVKTAEEMNQRKN